MADGRIFGHIQNWTVWPPSGGFYSTSYSMYHVLSVAGLLPVLGRHRVRPRAVRDHQAPARVQPVARRSDERLPDHERRWRRPRLGLLRRWQARRGHRVQRHLLQGAERRGLPRRRAGQGVSERRGRCDVAGRLGALEDPGRRPQAAHQRSAVRPPARRLQARRPRQRQHVGQRRPAGRQLRGDHVGHRAGERAQRDPELAAHEPVGDVRLAAVLARGELLDRDQPVHHGQGGRRPLPLRRHEGRDRPDPPDVGSDGQRERPVLHRHRVGEAQPRRHRRRRQREPRPRLGQRPGLQPEPLRGGRAAGDGGLQDVDRRSAARRAGVGAGDAADAAGRARLALGPRRGRIARSS